MLGLCVPSHIALVPERNPFYSKVAPTVGSSLRVEPRILGGMQSSRQRTQGKRIDPLLPSPLMREFTRMPSYAEMNSEQKNGLSHRYRALAKLKEYLATLTK